jgi:hypothetical protein
LVEDGPICGQKVATQTPLQMWLINHRALRVDPYLAVAFEVPESGDDLRRWLMALPATALTKDLPVFEPGDDMFDAGTNAAVVSRVVVVDDAAGFVAARRGDRWDAAVAPVAGDLVAAGEVRLVRR